MAQDTLPQTTDEQRLRIAKGALLRAHTELVTAWRYLRDVDPELRSFAGLTTPEATERTAHAMKAVEDTQSAVDGLLAQVERERERAEFENRIEVAS